jgi:uncharacterized protein (DUF2384 family)
MELTPRQALDALEAGLGLREEELAQALGSSRRTLHRWRMGAAYPQQAARRRLSELLELQQRVQETFRGTEAPRRWFHAPSRYLGGVTPAEAVRVGRIERVEAALEALHSGAFL